MTAAFSLQKKAFSLHGPKPFNKDKAWQQARELETTFISTLLQEWIKAASTGDTGFLGGGAHESALRPHLTKTLAESMDFRLTEGIYHQLLKNQGVAHDR